jgi:glycosyltransferase involved in cell wall biosynthesis
MRVLHVISGLDTREGGPTSALLTFVRSQVRAGLSVSVAATWTRAVPPDAAEPLREAGAAVTLIGPCLPPLRWHPRLARDVNKAVANADVVHIHALWEEIQHRAARAAQRRGVPYVFTPHGMLDPWSLRQGAVKKRWYLSLRLRRDLGGAAAIHYTDEQERGLAGSLGISTPAIVEPWGLDLAEFDDPPPAGSFRARHPLVGDRPLVLFLGRLHPKKGLDLLIPAFARARLGDAVLVIAGPGDEAYRAELEARARDALPGDRVVFTGMLRGRERIEALADADLFVLPSHQENFGVAVMEALAAGTPVLVSDRVNTHRQISEAGVGGTVEPTEQSVAEGLRRWMLDEELRRIAAARAAAFVRERHDAQAIAQRWVTHYAGLSVAPRMSTD